MIKVVLQNLKSIILFTILIIWGVFSYLDNSWINYDKKVTARNIPQQIETKKLSFEYKGFTIIPLAEFNVEARVLSKKRYFLGTEAKLAPVDLALGWGPMSFYQVLKDLNISQSGRWYHYSYKEAPIIPSEIVNNSANMHLIAANDKIKNKINKVRRGQIVFLKGYLVQISNQKGWHWVSSLSRGDSGDGSCEVVWVESFDVK